MPRLPFLVVVIWVGSLWTIGYIVAPTLFTTLDDRALAGTIAGRLFRIEGWLSIACALTLFWLLLRQKATQPHFRMCMILTGAMLVCTLIGYFGLQPFMAALRDSPGGLASDGARARFGMLHGISSAIYLLQSLLGAALIFKLR